MRADIRIKRVHDPAAPEDGTRVLVDRVWPRGVRKADAVVDHWLRAVAPSTELRKWFGHDAERFETFRQCYRDELATVPEALRELMAMARQGPLTLLFGARDREHNQAVVLREVLQEELAEEDAPNEPASPVCYAGRDVGGGGR